MVRDVDLDKMSSEDLENCVEVLGNLHYSDAKMKEVWSVLKEKISPEGTKILSGPEMINFGYLLSEIAKSNPEMLDLSRTNLDAVSVLGKRSNILLDQYIDMNSITTLDPLELASLGNMLCGLTALQWRSLMHDESFINSIPSIGELKCEIKDLDAAEVIGGYLKRLLDLESEGGVNMLEKSSFILELGWMLGTLNPYTLQTIPPQYFNLMDGAGLRNIADLSKLTTAQLERLSPHTASMLVPEQFGQHMNVDKRAALLAASGEDPVLVPKIEKYSQEMAEIEAQRDDAADDPEAESSAAKQLASLVLLISVFSFFYFF